MVRIGCVIMASGESMRFGGNKLIAPFLGKPLMLHAIDALPEALIKSTVAVTRSAEVRALAEARGVRTILHQQPDKADTIRIGIQQMAGMDGCLFLVADQPLLRTETILGILAAFEAQPDCIVRAAWDGAQGNPVLFPAALFPELLDLAPGQVGGAVIRRHRELVLTVEAQSALELEDIDTRAQLAALEARQVNQNA